MKAKDIVVGDDYEIVEGTYTTRATVTAVQKKTRRVYSSARSDFGGHMSTSIIVTIKTGDMARGVLPQAVRRPWAEAEGEHAAKVARKAEADSVVAALNAAGVSAYRAHTPGYINLSSVSLADASALLARLSVAGEQS